MLKNYFLLAIRTFLRNRIAFLINLAGMSIALGCAITAYVNYEYNHEFDNIQQNAASVYRIAFWNRTERGRVPYGVCPIPVANLVRENLHEGDLAIQYMSKNGSFRIGDELFQTQFIYTEPTFTEVFTIEKLRGSLSLHDKSTVLISDKLAKTYFGGDDVVGKALTQLVDGEPQEYIIGGVYREFPPNSSFRFDLMTSYDNYFADPAQRSQLENNWARWATTFLYLKNPSTIGTIEKQLSSFIKTQNEARPDLKTESFYIESFIGMSDRAVRQRNQGHWLRTPMPPAAVIAPFAMAGLLLLVACFNFMNNAIAVAGNRLKEIGIRKVIGGKRKELIFQFLAETSLFCLAAMLVAVFLAEYFTAGWNQMWQGTEITIRYEDNLELVVAISCLVIITALLAGAYPAFYISAFKPISILRGTTRRAGANLLTKGLLVFQFTISLAAVIFAIAFYFNSRFQKSYDLGYAWRNVIQVPLSNPQQFEELRNKLTGNPLINDIAGSEQHIYTSSYNASARNEKHVEKEIDVLNIGDNYFKTLNVRLLSGRGFQQDQVSDRDEAIIVNEEFVRVFGLGDNAIGHRMTLNDTIQVYIIGTVKDVYLGALFQPLGAVAFRYVEEEKYRYLVAATTVENLVATNDEIKRVWKELYPAQVYNGRLMEYSMVMALEHFDGVVILYTFLGIVAIIMSVSGLYSLVSLSLQKRTKELGIRKILGASTAHILFQSSRLFLIIMVVAFALGSMMGAVLVNAMMDSVWEYYEAVDIRVLSIAITALAAISIATIGAKIHSVAVSNPVDALRHE